MAAAKETKGGKGGKVGKMTFGAEKKMPKPAAGNMGKKFNRMQDSQASKSSDGGSFGLM